MSEVTPRKPLAEALAEIIAGDVETSQAEIEKHSTDASLFKVTPEVIVYPKHAEDMQSIVKFINEHKNDYENISVTARAAGTCMSGGSLNESIIVDVTRYLTKDDVDIANMVADIEPGLYFRDFEKETLPKHVTMPVYPASKSLAAFGGMIMNNCGGEKTLRYGQMRNFVNQMNVVLSDGSSATLKKMTLQELEVKKQQQDFEGKLYTQMHDLLEQNYDAIKAAKPKTTKNSAGYALWDIYDRKDEKSGGKFDLTQLFTGSQGTLGLMTDAQIRLTKTEEHERLVVFFFKKWDPLANIVNVLLPVGLESMETFDDTTLKLGLRFMPSVAKKIGKPFLTFARQFLPEVLIGMKMLGLPKLIVLASVSEQTAEAADEKVKQIVAIAQKMKIHHRVATDAEDAEKYWIMRRESFAMLREKVKGKNGAPFVDDICVLPEDLPKFLPLMLGILKKYDIKANIVGHAGSGNLHIIPLMDLREESERAKIIPASDEIYKLVIQYDGTITAEHNDGIMRTAYLKDMYGQKIHSLFTDVKNIFDPHNIFNPGKKVGMTKEYMENHLVGRG